MLQLSRLGTTLHILPFVLLFAACEEGPVEPEAPGRYTLEEIGTVRTGTFEAMAVNDHGQVAGSGALAAYRWADGEFTDLGAVTPDPASCFTKLTRAYAINANGTIAGTLACQARDGSRSGPHLVVWKEGRATLFDFGASDLSEMNAHGQIVGTLGSSVTQGFVWDRGHVTTLGEGTFAYGINDAGAIVGVTQTERRQRADGTWGRDTRATLWRDATRLDLGTLGGHSSRAISINNRGQVAGVSEVASGERHAFLWENGKMRDLGLLDGLEIWTAHINDLGQVVGNAARLSDQRVFLWQSGRMYDLETLLSSPDWDLLSAVDISDAGHILVTARNRIDGRWSGALLVPDTAP